MDPFGLLWTWASQHWRLVFFVQAVLEHLHQPLRQPAEAAATGDFVIVAYAFIFLAARGFLYLKLWLLIEFAVGPILEFGVRPFRSSSAVALLAHAVGAEDALIMAQRQLAAERAVALGAAASPPEAGRLDAAVEPLAERPVLLHPVGEAAAALQHAASAGALHREALTAADKTLVATVTSQYSAPLGGPACTSIDEAVLLWSVRHRLLFRSVWLSAWVLSCSVLGLHRHEGVVPDSLVSSIRFACLWASNYLVPFSRTLIAFLGPLIGAKEQAADMETLKLQHVLHTCAAYALCELVRLLCLHARAASHYCNWLKDPRRRDGEPQPARGEAVGQQRPHQD